VIDMRAEAIERPQGPYIISRTYLSSR
jgi:hypothetical protein